jgi:NAD(P)H-nitrite reductase large subunit
VTADRLLSINRYELPRIFECPDKGWRDFLLHPPEYYDERRLALRRNSWVTNVEPTHKRLVLRHRETLSYTKLLVASGGGRYIPEFLNQFRDLIMKFGTYEEARAVCDALPRGGHLVMLGGDMIGIDLARTLCRTGFKVTIIGKDYLFWPHELNAEELARYTGVLRKMGTTVITETTIAMIRQGEPNKPARLVDLADGQSIEADVVLSFCGLMPSLGFMAGAGVDLERGILVDGHLQSTDPGIWAAGDVCQIWSPEDNQYRFYYGGQNVKQLGRIAAINMTGGTESISTFQDEHLFVNDAGEIDSTFWHYR